MKIYSLDLKYDHYDGYYTSVILKTLDAALDKAEQDIKLDSICRITEWTLKDDKKFGWTKNYTMDEIKILLRARK